MRPRSGASSTTSVELVMARRWSSSNASSSASTTSRATSRSLVTSATAGVGWCRSSHWAAHLLMMVLMMLVLWNV